LIRRAGGSAINAGIGPSWSLSSAREGGRHAGACSKRPGCGGMGVGPNTSLDRGPGPARWVRDVPVVYRVSKLDEKRPPRRPRLNGMPAVVSWPRHRRGFTRRSGFRLRQEILFGIDGVRLFRALGVAPATWHANEWHLAFMMVERVRRSSRPVLASPLGDEFYHWRAPPVPS
jgi:hypothetical protein